MINEGTSEATGTVGTSVPMGQGAGRGIHKSLLFNCLFAPRDASIRHWAVPPIRVAGLSTSNRRLSRTGEVLHAQVQ